jgi:serine protease Do
MSSSTIRSSRWKVWIALVVAVGLGVVAGSALTAKTGHGPFGATVPVWVASAAPPVPASEVSFANGFSAIAAKDLPAVVNIASSKVVRNPAGNSLSPFFNDPFFRQFFGPEFQAPRRELERSLGSGVIINSDGYILTNNHVISGATEIKVTLADKRELTAKIIGADPRSDIAVVKINATHLPVMVLGDSSTVRVGDFCLAIGSPFGLSQTVTMGIISAKGRGNLGIEDYEDFIQTDAAINPGNSGGALVNVQGELIGINTAILSGGSGGNQGVGFAIPINMAREVMDQILKHGKVIRGYLGAYIQTVTPEIAKAFGLTNATGALLSEVEPNSPAATAGLERGDVVVAMDGRPVTDPTELRNRIAMTAPGTVVQLKVLRNGAERTFSVKLGELPAQAGTTAANQGQGPSQALQGLSVDNLTPGVAHELGLPRNAQGVVVTSVEPGSAADQAGVRQGDVIQEVNRKAVHNLREFNTIVGQLGKQPVLLLIDRGGNTLYLVIQSD